MATTQDNPNPTPGEKATAQAKAALDEFRRRAASRASVFGHPGITLGPGFGGPFGPEAPPFNFPGMPSMASGGPPPATAGPSLIDSLGTLMRLSVDLLNSGLQGFVGATGARAGTHGGSHGCGCGCECESCCDHFASHDCGCGSGCGCGCMPGVHNCCH